MSFKVLIHPRVIKKAKKYLTKSQRTKLSNFLKALEENPIPPGCDIKKLSQRRNAYRFRIGKYRVIYFVFWDEKIVEVHDLEHRESA
uniref:Plasmid stabilization system, RelE/StbE family, protein RelE n=1 Tax=Thermococcus sp. CIR10 TaxID=1197731 RepID=L0B8G6_9EURY|nr:type II toxin-antitoxin system RelE/ParE family toxin [Thermococcus sp. CIR10]AFZ84262.1 plasmid stabilization system, RelE/StbE family, protein RelE [Thermococcus sp. CIR10]